MDFIQSSTTATNTDNECWEWTDILVDSNKWTNIYELRPSKQEQYEYVQQGLAEGWIIVVGNSE